MVTLKEKNLFDNIYAGRKVLITGHTGFKGSWLCLLLHQLGADVYGYALSPPTDPSLYGEAQIDELVTSVIADIRDLKILNDVVQQIQPEIVIHMAAQPLVRDSYKEPVETYEINVMGTVHLLDACRNVPSVKAIVNVTTDKCYENREWQWGYRENEPMGGFDPYSSSKGCSELITSAYRSSYFHADGYHKHGVGLASARAGNVIGGGDWAFDRLIPDFIKAVSKGEKIHIRSPFSVRPWQHVLEPLNGYLMLTAKLYTEGPKYARAWNFGPDDKDVVDVKTIIHTLCELWGDGASYVIEGSPQLHEATYLKLDCSLAKTYLNWFPRWNIIKTLNTIVDWNKDRFSGKDIRQITENQIVKYFLDL